MQTLVFYLSRLTSGLIVFQKIFWLILVYHKVLLFILFINDFPSIFDSSVAILLFADYTKLF